MIFHLKEKSKEKLELLVLIVKIIQDLNIYKVENNKFIKF